MMSAREIREYLNAKPFKPFRIFLSDGSTHEVPHPEFGWVFGNSLYVGKTGELPFGLDDFAKQLSILHITRVEPAGKTKAKK